MLPPEDEIDMDLDGERDLFGDSLQEEGDVSLEFAEADLDTDQILALAAEEEARCALLEQEMEEAKRREQEEKEFRKQQRERDLALQKLRAVRNKRVDLETSLSQPSAHSSPAKRPSRAPVMAKQPRRSYVTDSARPSCSGKPVIEQQRSVAPPTARPGQSEFDSFAQELLYSVQQLKDGQTAPFSKLMAQAMKESPVATKSMRKSESLPNVNVVGEQVDKPPEGGKRPPPPPKRG